MDEANFLEEIRNWEHILWYGNVQFEEECHVDFDEESEGSPLSHLKTHFRMTVNRYMIFDRRQETSYTAITLNPESNFTRQEKNHFLFHWNTQTWMLCKNVALMISGTSMGQELCQIHGQVSLKLLYWEEDLKKDKCGPGGDWQESS